MNVHHLELFYYVAKYEGITNAVRKIPYGVQQPAISGQLLKLEKSLGVKLFTRRPFTLTKAGEELYDYVYPFFSRIVEVESKLKGEGRHQLRIAASAATLKNHLPVVLGLMKKENPELKLSLQLVDQTEIEPLVLEEKVDVGITVLLGKPLGNLQVERLLDLAPILILPVDAKEETLEDLLEPEQFHEGQHLRYPIVGLASGKLIGKVFNDLMDDLGVHWETTVQVDDVEVIHEYVLQGFGMGLGVAVPGRKLPPGLKMVPLTNCEPLSLAVLYPERCKPIATQLITYLHEAASALTDC